MAPVRASVHNHDHAGDGGPTSSIAMNAAAAYANRTRVTRPYEKLCIIDSETGSSSFDDRTGAAAVERAKPQACRCGADALIIDDSADLPPELWTAGHGEAAVTAIRYLDHADNAQPAAPSSSSAPP